MSQAPSATRYDEVVVLFTTDDRASTAPGPGRAGGPDGNQSHMYTVLIYTSVAGPWGSEPATPPRGRPSQLGGLPLIAVEQLAVRWSHYRDFARTAGDLEEMGKALRGQFFDFISPALQALIEGQADFQHPVRIWWHSDAPELVELPWELFVEAAMAQSPIQYHLVRGLPAESLPLVPLEGDRLRLAFIHGNGPVTELMQGALRRLPHIDVVPIDGPVREALSRAAAERFELVHLITDGIVTSAFEGFLTPRDSREGRLTARDVSRLLRGSRVTVLGLTEMTRGPAPRADTKRAPQPMPETLAPYRAFTHLGAAPEVLPSIVAPLGYLDDAQVTLFWRTFYRGLASTLSIEEAHQKAQSSRMSAPISVFLRHRLGQQFLRSTALPDDRSDPTKLSADLQINRSLAERLQLIDSNFGDLDDNVSGSELFAHENSRQSRLEEQLGAWTKYREEDLP